MIRVRNMFAALILTFAAFLLSVKGQCDNSDFEYDDHGNIVYDVYSPNVAPVCFMLYQQLEQTLLNDHLNLYKLRRVFFPNGKANPIVVAVTYNISFRNITDELCPGVNRRKNNTVNILNGTDTAANFSANTIWTSSIAFSVLHPNVINWLLPSIIYLLGPFRDHYFNIRDNGADILLSLDVPFLSCIPSENQVIDALNDLTTMLKAFAEAQAQVSSSDSKYKGYTVEGNAKIFAYTSFYIPTFMLQIVFCFLCARLIITKWTRNYLEMVALKKKPYYQLFLLVCLVTILVSWMYFVVEVVGLCLWVSRAKSSIATVVTKFGGFILCIFINLLPGIIISRNSKDLSGLVFSFCCCTCKMSHIILRLFLAWHFVTFTSILVWSFIPTLILVFVNPIQTLAVVLFAISIFCLLCIYLVVYYLALPEVARGHIKTRWKKRGRQFLNLLIPILIIFILMLMISIAIYIIHKGVRTGGILGFLLVFAPGIITAIAVRSSKKLLAQYKEEQNSNALPTLLALIVRTIWNSKYCHCTYYHRRLPYVVSHHISYVCVNINTVLASSIIIFITTRSSYDNTTLPLTYILPNETTSASIVLDPSDSG